MREPSAGTDSGRWIYKQGGNLAERFFALCDEEREKCPSFVCAAERITHSIMDAGMEQQSWIAVSGEVRWAV